jgi:Na+/citrate or Na+/malate symporter
MENPESEELRQIRELRAEVRSLRRTILYVVIGVVAVFVSKSPKDLVTIILVGVVLGFLFERKNFSFFSSRGHDYKPDA